MAKPKSDAEALVAGICVLLLVTGLAAKLLLWLGIWALAVVVGFVWGCISGTWRRA